MKLAQGSTALLIALEGVDAAVESKCDQAVSFYKRTETNAACRDLCIANETDTFDAAGCAYQHYVPHGSDYPTVDSCFTTMIYGNITQLWYTRDPVVETSTPALCQARCQANEHCANWSWTTENYSIAATRYMCHILREDDLYGAINDIVDAGVSYDAAFCAKPTFDKCKAPNDKCLRCEGRNRCGVYSKEHVSGFRHCDWSKNRCDPYELYTTTVPPTTTTSDSTIPSSTPTTTIPSTASATTTKSTSKPTTIPTTVTTATETTYETTTTTIPTTPLTTSKTIQTTATPNTTSRTSTTTKTTPAPPTTSLTTGPATTVPTTVTVITNTTEAATTVTTPEPHPSTRVTTITTSITDTTAVESEPATETTHSTGSRETTAGVWDQTQPETTASVASQSGSDSTSLSTDEPEITIDFTLSTGLHQSPEVTDPTCDHAHNCRCAAGHGCGCCKGVEIRVMDRPKHLNLLLDN